MPRLTNSSRTPSMKFTKHQTQQPDQQHADVGGRADQTGEKRARAVGPDFGHQRHAERPFAAHAERGDESQHGDVPGLASETAKSREDRVGRNAQRHRAHAADAIAKPAEQHAARGRADEEHGHDHAEPLAFERGIGGELAVQQLVERGRPDEREHADLEAVEHPAQQRGDQRHPFAALVGCGDGAGVHAIASSQGLNADRSVYVSSQPRSVAKSDFRAARFAAASPLGRYSTWTEIGPEKSLCRIMLKNLGSTWPVPSGTC